eukprot:TRINITY_DN19090_c0_g1_i1.p1 TRINITY_DN19090_c0_g1~~TRINITY_DN19090_c0_g1_i1.p1  ORF type:complete len:133 (+),score=36.00 TRINITY_DN19090_c0_g1_i1:66-464(+)
MSYQDWNTVVLRKPTSNAPKPTSEKLATRALQTGAQIETSKKFNGGKNKTHSSDLDSKKLDEENTELRHQHVSLNLGRSIQQARQAKNMTQKELAVLINEKQSVVNDYESGRAIPNSQIINKMEKALGKKLR